MRLVLDISIDDERRTGAFVRTVTDECKRISDRWRTDEIQQWSFMDSAGKQIGTLRIVE